MLQKTTKYYSDSFPKDYAVMRFWKLSEMTDLDKQRLGNKGNEDMRASMTSMSGAKKKGEGNGIG